MASAIAPSPASIVPSKSPPDVSMYRLRRRGVRPQNRLPSRKLFMADLPALMSGWTPPELQLCSLVGGSLTLPNSDVRVEASTLLGPDLQLIQAIASLWANVNLSDPNCPPGYECVAVNNDDPFEGAVCAPCARGQFCPYNTSNAISLVEANICPKGSYCETPSSIKPCPAGSICPPGSFQAIDCPDMVQETFLTWGQVLYCPERGASIEVLENICEAGYTCPNTSFRELCPKGHFCPHGSNTSTACEPGILSNTPADKRCPQGSTFEPAQNEMILILFIGLAVLVSLLEFASCIEIRKRRRRVWMGAWGAFFRRPESDTTHECQMSLEGTSKPPMDALTDKFHYTLLKRLHRGSTYGSMTPCRRSSFSSRKSERQYRSSYSGRKSEHQHKRSELSTVSLAFYRRQTEALQRAKQTENICDTNEGSNSIPVYNSKGVVIGSMPFTPERTSGQKRNSCTKSSNRPSTQAPPMPVSSSPPASPPPPDTARPNTLAHLAPSWTSRKLWSAPGSTAKQSVDTPAASHGEENHSSNPLQNALKGIGDPSLRSKGRTLIKLELNRLDFHIGSAHVLRDLSTILLHGELVGLMGESGSGKTTLLNVLGGRAGYGWTSGEMLLNSRPYHASSIRHLLGYVPQANVIFKELTVYENLLCAAKLRLTRRVSATRREQLVEMALDLLGLQQVRHFVCDPAIGERLSGGQLRRVGIGIELVCDPPIMLLDEPTSALDAVNTRLVVAALKDLAQRGVLVLASLHQPRFTVYEMLDRLLLLRKGEIIYGGMRADAGLYFDSLGYSLRRQVNPADFFIEIAFGFEQSVARGAAGQSLDRGVRHNELRDSFGLDTYWRRCRDSGVAWNVSPDSEVTSATLGALWRHWYTTARRSANLMMEVYFNKQQSDERRRAIAILHCCLTVAKTLSKSTHAPWRRSVAQMPTFLSFQTRRRTPSPAVRARMNRMSRCIEKEAERVPVDVPSCITRASFGQAQPGRNLAPDLDSATVSPPPSPPGVGADARRERWLSGSLGRISETLDERGSTVMVDARISQLTSVQSGGAESRMTNEATTVPRLIGGPFGKSVAKSPVTAPRSMHVESEMLETPQHDTPDSLLQCAVSIHSSDAVTKEEEGGLVTPPMRSSIEDGSTPECTITRGGRTQSRSSSAAAAARAARMRNSSSAPQSVSHPSSQGSTPRSCRFSLACGTGKHTSDEESSASTPRSGNRVSKMFATLISPLTPRSISKPPSLSTAENLKALQQKVKSMGVARDEFCNWFRSDERFACLREDLANEIWSKAADAAQQAYSEQGRSRRLQLRIASFSSQRSGSMQERDILPTWVHLRTVMDTWQPSWSVQFARSDRPGRLAHLAVCIVRYAKKSLRTRLRTYLLFLVTGTLGLLCGVLHGDDPDRNDCLLFYLLFNTMFASICSTSVIATFGGTPEIIDLFRHEAYSGVSQLAEGLARIVIDLLQLACLSPVFALPLLTFGAIRTQLIIPWMAFTWALSPLGYIFTVLAPGNATVLTTSTTFVICAFVSGFFGIKLSTLPTNIHWLIKLSPGYCCFMLVTFGNAIAEPFDTKRWAITRHLYFAHMLPQSKEELLSYELGHVDWRLQQLRTLAAVGAVLRIISLMLFYCRSNYQFAGKAQHLSVAIRKKLLPVFFKRAEMNGHPIGSTLSFLESRLPRNSASVAACSSTHASIESLDGSCCQASPNRDTTRLSAPTLGSPSAIAEASSQSKRHSSPEDGTVRDLTTTRL